MLNFSTVVKENREEIISRLIALLEIPSIKSSTREEGAPFGHEIAKALEYMLEMAKEDGFTVKNLDGYVGVIDWKCDSSEQTFGILGHLDVVPPGEGWTKHPFEPSIQDGKLFARGAIDDKGPTMAAYMAMLMLKKQGLVPNQNIRFILGTDEESGWECMEYYKQKEPLPDFGFAPDADFPVIFAEKGVADIYISSSWDTLKSPLLRFESGERLNMVPAKAVAEVVVSREKQQQWEEKFYQYNKKHGITGEITEKDDILTLTIFGKQVHGSTPELGVNAGIHLANFLVSIEEVHPVIEEIANYYMNDTRGEKLAVAYSDETFGALTINVGSVKIEGNKAQYGLNIRYPSGVTIETIMCKIASKITANAEISLKDHLTPHAVNPEDERVQTLYETYKDHTNDETPMLVIGGATYARTMPNGVAFGALFPNREDVAHQKDEYILIEDLLLATTIYMDALHRLVIEKH
ncbi:MAG: dipeptidase PepV [Bacilli bacterium]